MKLRLAVVAALLAVAGTAQADTPPSVWERAKAPEIGDEYELHTAVQRRLLPIPGAEQSEQLRALQQIERMRVLAMLQSAGAEKSKNPLLRFDLGETYSAVDNHPRAAEVLRAALAEFPDHPQANRGWHLLALACGHTGDHDCELKTYHEVLRRETEDDDRMTPSLNLAETVMHQGDLREAIEGYRETLRLAARTEERGTTPLAMWGLAVALDRAGERYEAEKEAKFALELELSLGFRNPARRTPPLVQSRSVFYVPDYEVNWYLALGEIASAKRVTSAREALVHWKEAERCFARWVAGAEKAKTPDRWLPIAKARLAQVKADVAKAEVAAQKEPPQVHEQGKPLFL